MFLPNPNLPMLINFPPPSPLYKYTLMMDGGCFSHSCLGKHLHYEGGMFTDWCGLGTFLANLFCLTLNYTTRRMFSTCQLDSDALQNLSIKYFRVKNAAKIICLLEEEKVVATDPWCLSKYNKFKAST